MYYYNNVMIRFLNNFRDKLFFKFVDISNLKILSSLIILLFLSIIINLGARYYEKTIWEKNPNVFSSDNIPLVRSGDPAYFLNIAKYLKENKSLQEYNKKLNFPTSSEGEIKPPLLSLIISILSKNSSLNEIIKAGNNLVLFSSILTTSSIFFLFFVIGRPFEGIVASVGGGISTNYLMRSGIGYIDTDILNLFFMYFLFGFIYLSSKKQKNLITGLFLITFTGLLGKLFYLWYPKPELILMSFFSLVFFTWFNTKDWKIIFLNSFIYILLTDPNIYIDGFSIVSNNP